MEAKIAAVEFRVDNLEDRFEKHEIEDARAHKYNNAVVENMLEKIAQIQLSAARFEAELSHRAGNESTVNARLQRISDRLATLERLTWIAVGGVIVITGLVSVIGGRLLKFLA